MLSNFKMKSNMHVLLRRALQCRLMSTIPNSEYDVVIIGGGHNGLVAAGYLQRSGAKVCVLERRHIVGGAAVTEEIIPGFKFSRASYVLSLLRPEIIKELELKKYGLKLHLRNPSSYTPIKEEYWSHYNAQSLTLGSDEEQNFKQISQFSKKDAAVFIKYEKQMQDIATYLDPFLDLSPATVTELFELSTFKKLQLLYSEPSLLKAIKSVGQLGKDLPATWKVLTAPIKTILDNWFESEPLRATLATDALIGTMTDTKTPGSGYVLLHHVMGELEGKKGVWGYPEGGMGAVTQAMAKSAIAHGAHIFTNQTVKEIIVDSTGNAKGVLTADNKRIGASIVMSNATSYKTFVELLPPGCLSQDFITTVRNTDYTSPVTKINVALSRLPNFVADPNISPGKSMAHHQTTIHLNCEHMSMLDEACAEAKMGRISEKPMIEMVLPSVLDRTISPKGAHVCLLFTQFTPYNISGGWGEEAKEAYALRVFETIEEYAPGFKESIVGKEVLPPPELERIFGLTGGNIFHGAISLDQLFLCRSSSSGKFPSNPLTPIKGLLLCGSGSHPGGGVMGSPGRIASKTAIKILKKAR